MNVSLRQKFVNSRQNVPVNTRPFLYYCFDAWRAGKHYDVHEHPYFQVIQILDGRMEVDCGKGWQTVENRAAHVLPPGFRHSLKTSVGFRSFGMEFTVEPDDFGLLDAMRRTFPAPAIQPMHFHESWGEKLENGFPLECCARLAVLNTLMDWTVALVMAKDKSAEDPEATRLIEFLRNCSRQRVNVAEAARKLHLSVRKAQRICSRRFGCGIAQLHKKIRIEEASRMLLNSGMNVGEIADACGFDDIYSFSHVFIRIVGISPSAFRRKIKEG